MPPTHIINVFRKILPGQLLLCLNFLFVTHKMILTLCKVLELQGKPKSGTQTKSETQIKSETQTTSETQIKSHSFLTASLSYKFPFNVLQ